MKPESKSISRKFVYFCAGADSRVLSGGNINGLLLNVPATTRSAKAIANSLDFIKLSGAKHFMLDSGGYQLLKSQEKGVDISHYAKRPILEAGRFNITPFHVVKAAEILQPAILVALDFPIRKMKNKEDQEKEFRSKLKFNVKWAIRTAELREKYCPQVKLFLPIQCYTLDHLDIFLKRIQGIHFDGVSMPVRNLNFKEISLFLIRFHQMGIKRVHLLGTSSFYNILLCAYLANHLFEWVSLDSTSWMKAAGLGRYLNPDLTRTRIAAEAEKRPAGKLGCKCPVCAGRILSNFQELLPKEKVVFLHVHNYWTTEKAFRDCFRNSRSLESTARFLKRTCANVKRSQKLLQCLRELDEDTNLSTGK